MWRRVVPRLLTILLVAIPLGCYNIQAPPIPKAERVPTVVGQIVGGTPTVRYLLSSGDVVDIRDASGLELRTQLGSDRGDPPGANGPRGGLILAGEDSVGRFYAASRTPREDGCFPILGPGYLQEGRVLLSSGLVLALAPEFRRTNDRNTIDPSWLFEYDDICLDARGQVTSIHQEALGS